MVARANIRDNQAKFSFTFQEYLLVGNPLIPGQQGQSVLSVTLLPCQYALLHALQLLSLFLLSAPRSCPTTAE